MRSVSFILLLISIGYSQSGNTSDYVVNEDDGHAYKLMYHSETWQTAKKKCEKDGAKLAVPKSEDEFSFIQKIVRGMKYQQITGDNKYKLLAWLGVSNLEDYRVWKNVDGENIQDTGYHTWATNYTKDFASPDPKEPHCAGVDAVNPGLREHWCHHSQPYVCEKISFVDKTIH